MEEPLGIQKVLSGLVSDQETEEYCHNKKLELVDTTNISKIDHEIEQAIACECCGMQEVCTQAYIQKVKDSYSGNWLCGLCSEAVKEMQARTPCTISMQEAIASHKEFYQKFNSTVRLNPKLSLTCSMKDIARRSLENRCTKNGTVSMTSRSISCVARF